MDPVTEARVVRAADRLISGRTGILVAHRLSTTERAEPVAVLESVGSSSGSARPAGRRGRPVPRPARRCCPRAPWSGAPPRRRRHRVVRRSTTPSAPPRREPEPGPAECVHADHRAPVGPPRIVLFLVSSLTGAFGASPGGSGASWSPSCRRGAPILVRRPRRVPPRRPAPAARQAFRTLPALVDRGGSACGRGAPRADGAAPAGAHAAGRGGRPHDGRRPVGALRRPLGRLRQRPRHRRGDRPHGGTWLAGAVLLVVMVASALASTLGRRVAGRSGGRRVDGARRFGRSLVSALESVRTVKLAAATPAVHGTCARSTPAGSTRRSASTGCRPCSTAYPS